MQFKKLNAEKVMRLCIRENYFTGGSVREYEDMLTRIDKGTTVGKVAETIKRHSRTEKGITDICLELIKDCQSY